MNQSDEQQELLQEQIERRRKRGLEELTKIVNRGRHPVYSTFEVASTTLAPLQKGPGRTSVSPKAKTMKAKENDREWSPYGSIRSNIPLLRAPISGVRGRPRRRIRREGPALQRRVR